METQEREISLFDLLIYVAKGWRSMLACMLAAAVLNGGIQYAREIENVKEYEAQLLEEEDEPAGQEEKKKEAVQTISQLRKEMSEEEIKAVDKVVRMEKTYDKQKKYMDTSLLMTMEPEHINIARLQYWIDTDYRVNYAGITKKDRSSCITDTYLNHLRDNGWKKKALKVSGIQTQPQYFDELLSMESRDSMFTVSVKYAEEGKLRKVISVLEQEIQSLNAEITELYGAHDLRQVTNSIELVVDHDMENNQQSHNNTLTTLENTIDSNKAAFNDNQKSLYAGKIIINEEEQTQTDAEPDTAADTDAQEELLPPPAPRVRAKNAVLGAMIGAFFVCMLRAMLYLMSGKLRPEDVVDSYFGIPKLGFIEMEQTEGKKGARKGHTKLDLWLDKLSRRNYGNLSEEQQLKIIAAKVEMYCADRQMKQLYFNSSANCSGEKTARLAAMLQERDLTVKDGLSILQDAAAVEDMGRSDGVIFIEQAGTSRYEDMDREIRLCREHEKYVVGLVVIL